MTPPSDFEQLTALPIQPRPIAGETAVSYVHRLARANHLRPSYLRGFLSGPPHYAGGRIVLNRLAVLAGRTPEVLARTLTGLNPPNRVASADPHPRPARHTLSSAAKAELFPLIRADAEQGMSIRALSTRYQVHRRTIRQALESPAPPPRKPLPSRGSTMDQYYSAIAAIFATSTGRLTFRRIWERLVDEYGSEVTSTTVRDYVLRHDHFTHWRRSGPD